MVRHLSTWLYVKANRVTERLERNESNVEHAANEAAYEWDHIIHTFTPIIASVFGGGQHG